MSRICPAFLICALAASAAGPVTLPLWEKGAPGWEGRGDRESIDTGPDGGRRISNVTRPTITVFLPAPEAATGGAMVVCPGGGYMRLAIDKEGEDVARWLNTLGVAAFVLRYRLMATGDGPAPTGDELQRRRAVHAPIALEDAKRAVRIVRHRAAEWRVDPRRIAIMGFSAGGHLTANLGMNYDPGKPDAADAIDRLSSRPGAIVPIYGRLENAAFPPDAPPAFLLHAHDDPTVPSEASTDLYVALKKAKVPVELHIFPKGGHGFGIRKTGHAIDQWPELLRGWLAAQGWLKK